MVTGYLSFVQREMKPAKCVTDAFTNVLHVCRRRCAIEPRSHGEALELNFAAPDPLKSGIERSSPRPISTAQLKELPLLHPRPINQMVSLGSYPVNPVGDLILEWASCLDAFSAYPIRT